MRKFVKTIFTKPLWQEPLTAFLMRLVDPFDWLVCKLRGFHELPLFSRRVRSNGLTRQFGGRRFVAEGTYLVNLMQSKANLSNRSKILEIGCGVGRSAIPISAFLDDGHYTGMDIERASIKAFKANKQLQKSNFSIEWLDIYNEVYNPEGKISADEYCFPYNDGTFDLIFHFSVFTHMLEHDVRNYIAEICRLTSKNGICVFSSFLRNPDPGLFDSKLPFKVGNAFCMSEENMCIMVGYDQKFFDSVFEEFGFIKIETGFIGTWRGHESQIDADLGFSQDILMYKRDNKN